MGTPPLRSDRYVLERELGRGGAATVWLAHDALLDRPVAIKVLTEALIEDRAWLARFNREARVAAQLQHPNLVSIYDFDADAEPPYLVMAYMPGGSLRERLTAGDVPDVQRLAEDLLRALAHIHAAGVIHRDVKPGNVLLDADGRACLSDFGIARPEDATAITQVGEIPGTARYMAPELWRGVPADERSDLYSCGVVLSECLGPDTPLHVTTLVSRMTAEDRELRPRSAVEALRLLQPPQERPIPVFRSRRTVRPATVALGAAVLVAGALGAVALLGGDDEAPRTATRAPTTTTRAATTATTTAAAPDGRALNDRGYQLIQQGRYEEAIPILQQAVAALEGSGRIEYAFALFNLGNALRLAGRPEEAIPILERRLQIPNQTKAVKAELKEARKAARAQAK